MKGIDVICLGIMESQQIFPIIIKREKFFVEIINKFSKIYEIIKL